MSTFIEILFDIRIKTLMIGYEVIFKYNERECRHLASNYKEVREIINNHLEWYKGLDEGK